MTTNHWYSKSCPAVSSSAQQAAKDRQANLTKPIGSLGKLETIAERFAGWQNTSRPTLDRIMIRVFAGDHGVCAQNVSAFPQEVTTQMVMNFLNGGAAISVLSDAIQADFAVVTMGLANPLLKTSSNKLIQQDIAKGTADFSEAPAMTTEQMQQALSAGKNVIQNQVKNTKSIQLFIGGEMGIGNTSSASAIYSTLLNITPEEACGPGTGINAAGIQHKANIVEKALLLHQPSSAKDALQKLGGFEIAALVGAYINAAQEGIPSLIDGFICTAAALIAVQLNPSCQNWFIFAHQSAEPAHKHALKQLNAKPLLDIGMHLGEGSGSAVALPLLQTALSLHNKMATFEEASVACKKG